MNVGTATGAEAKRRFRIIAAIADTELHTDFGALVAEFGVDTAFDMMDEALNG